MADIRASYFRYAAEYFKDFDSVEDAIRFLALGEDQGMLTSGESRIFDGEQVVLEGSALQDAVFLAVDKL